MTKILNIGIIGLGHVGGLTREILQLGNSSLVCYDKKSGDPYPAQEFAHCDFLVVCVNTPSSADGRADLEQVYGAFETLPASVPVILRSTVPPGTCAHLAERYSRDVVFWPEYLGESRFASQSWARFGAASSFQVLGGDPGSAMDAWLEYLSEVVGPETRIFRTGHLEAELIKYMENSYFALKVTFVNEFRRVSEALGADWHDVREGWLLDPRVERDHTAAFQFSPGYSGKCLPKDVSAIIAAVRSAGFEMPLMEAVHLINTQTNEAL